MKRVSLVLLIFLPAVVFSLDFDTITDAFLRHLTAKHKNTETLVMTDIETLTIPGAEDEPEALIRFTFKTPEESRVFAETLAAENIAYGSFPAAENIIALFSDDMLVFIMKAAIGL